MITTIQATTATSMIAFAPRPGMWSLSTPVSRTTRVPLRIGVSAAQALRAWSMVIMAHPPTGCSSYDLLPDGSGIVVWAIPCGGFADPEATYLGTILFSPHTVRDGCTVGDQSDVVGLLIAPPYSVADLLAHVQALFGVPVDPAREQPAPLRQ